MISQHLARFSSLSKRTSLLNLETKYGFGLISEYNKRSNVKLSGTHSIPEKAQFFVTSSRPGNFGDHIDFKATIDNWFDENRVYNE
jgi:ubiquinol-cytochrome c reductase iron-sulfur subunit